MEDLIASARAGDLASAEVLADLYEERGLRAVACLLRLAAKGYHVPTQKHYLPRLLAAGLPEQAGNPLQHRSLARVAYQELREADDHARRTALVTVHCVACGRARTGERVTMAKFRKCCDASMSERKHCRDCGCVLTREWYFARKYCNAKGWATVSKCDACATGAEVSNV